MQLGPTPTASQSDKMDLLISTEHIVLLRKKSGLVCDRSDGQMRVKPRSEVESLLNKSFEASGTSVQSLGRVQGFVGKLRVFPDAHPRLVLIRNSTCVGELPAATNRDGSIYRIDRIALLPIADNSVISTAELIEGFAATHHQLATEHANNKAAEWFPFEAALARGQQKTREGLTLLSHGMQQHASAATLNRISSHAALGNQPRERDRLEQRLLLEVEKTFNDSVSFYYCANDDITSCTQRRYDERHAESDEKQRRNSFSWKHADERFFWNMNLLKDLITQDDELVDEWIIPVMQGYVEFGTFSASALLNDPNHPHSRHQAQHLPDSSSKFTVALISRRSRHRAGTRYRRRGVDALGHVANYVETEQILLYEDFVCSFTLTRGSVPVYWKQMGMRYRPPPELEKDSETNLKSFSLHMQNELKRFDHVVCISLVEQHGRESVLSEAFLENTLRFNSPDVTFIAFDFHDHCRGLRFERVQLLVDAVEEILREMKYFWVAVKKPNEKSSDLSVPDGSLPLCRQNNVFRINCIDCLDRTNVVQMSIARNVLEVMLRRLNILAFESNLPRDALLRFQCMWANNGDVISRQYAGTDALKADFTRTGERNLFGMMKDGYKSVSRYYQKTFKALYRQAAIEISLGKCLIEQEILADVQRESVAAVEADAEGVDAESPTTPTTAATPASKTTTTTAGDDEFDRIRELLEDGRKMIVPDGEIVLGNWALCDAHNVASDNTTTAVASTSTAATAATEIDRILILTHSAYFVAEYNDESDEFVRFSYVPLRQVYRIEFGPEEIERNSGEKIGERDADKDRNSDEGGERALTSTEAAEQVVNRVLTNSAMVPTHLITIYYRQMLPSSSTNDEEEWIDKYHQFRCPSFRLFNNVVIQNHSSEDMRETLKSIAETMSHASEHLFEKEKRKNSDQQRGLKVLESHVKLLPRDALANAPSTVSTAAADIIINPTAIKSRHSSEVEIYKPNESSTSVAPNLNLEKNSDSSPQMAQTEENFDVTKTFPINNNQQHRPSLTGEMAGLQALSAAHHHHHKTRHFSSHSEESEKSRPSQTPPLIQHADFSSSPAESARKFDETEITDNRKNGSTLLEAPRSNRPPRSNSEHTVLGRAAQQTAEALEGGREQGSLSAAIFSTSPTSARPSGLGLSMEKLNAVGGALTKNLAHRMHGVLGSIAGHQASSSSSSSSPAGILQNGRQTIPNNVNTSIAPVAAAAAPASAAAAGLLLSSAEKQRQQRKSVLEERIKNSKSRIILL